MRSVCWILCVPLICCASLVFTGKNDAQDKPQDPAAAAPSEYKITQADIDKKNRVAPTPEGLAAARKVFGYDCALCHGLKGDGAGEVVESMKLQMNNWGDPATLAAKTDGELFYIIGNGKGKMTGEGDRLADTMRWNLVNYVRSLAKKGTPSKPAIDTPKS
jgi:mono/diheme cytochrome c family protein